MTNQAILTSAIEKAVKNGWTGEVPDPEMRTPDVIMANFFHMSIAFLMRHDFAKAFFPEEEHITHLTSDGIEWIELKEAGWKYHLQKMVLEPDPIRYLEKFL